MEIEKELDENSMDEEDNTNEETCEKLLDVAGLTRAYKKMSSSKHDSFYKDVLCIAINSLCGWLKNCKYF